MWWNLWDNTVKEDVVVVVEAIYMLIDSASFHSSYKLSYCQTPQLESLGGMINNSLLKLELLTNGEAVISHELRESLGCSKTDAANTKKVLAANSVYISY